MTAETPLYVSQGDGFNPATAAKIVPISAPVLTSPFTGVNIPYLLTQRFQCHASKYQPLAMNTRWGTWASAMPADYDGFILCAESPREDIGGQTVRWTRTYAKVPAPYNLAGNYSYHFPEFIYEFGGVNVPVTSSRDAFPETVVSRIHFEYFLLDPVNGPLRTPLDIQKTFPVDIQRIYRNAQGVPVRNYCNFLTQDDTPTIPSIIDWLSWIENGTEIIAQVGPIRNWMGNIIERQTVYILPQ
jgi:hypothetical protein